ncbi:MAG: RDD family protein, partial [Acidobacteriia bacterium]|nr:RDD family protein [Terriglobia bacterium]
VSRMLALMIDIAVIAAFGQVIRQLLAPLNAFGEDVAGAVYIVGYFAISMLYGAVAEWIWRGQTVGKRLFGLRVVDARGFRLELSQVIVRNVMRLLDGLPALYLVGGIACFFQRHHRRLGDIAAGTVVIRTPKLAHPDFDRLLGGKYNSLAESRHLAARLRQKVSVETAQVALDALMRRDELRPDARLALFHELAEHFRTLVPYPPEVDEQLSDEQYVRNVTEIVYGRAHAPSVPVP